MARRAVRRGRGWSLLALLLGISACGKIVGARFEEAHLRPDASGGGGRAGAATREPDGFAGLAPESAGQGSVVSNEAGQPAVGGAGAEQGGAADAGAGGQPDMPLCPEAVDVELMPEPENGRPSAAFLARSLGVIDETFGHPRCHGVLLTGTTFLTWDCEPEVGEWVSFRSQVRASTPNEPAPRISHTIEAVTLDGFHDNMTFLKVFADWQSYERIVPWSVRQPFPGEKLTAISYEGDGLARAIELELPPGTLAENDVTYPAPDATSFVFGDDGKLLGLCAFDPCFQPLHCISTSVFFNSNLAGYIYAAQDAQFGDWTGDKAADAVLDLGNVAMVTASTSIILETWAASLGLPSEYEHSILLGDFTGDGLSDLAVLDQDEVSVSRTDHFGSDKWTQWLPLGFGAWIDRPLVGEVDGVGGDDMVAYDGDDIVVARSTGTSFAVPQSWITNFPFGFEKLELADVTGEGFADLIVVRGSEVEVWLSTGKKFDAKGSWLSAEALGPPGWFFHDLDRDGRTDAILLTRDHFAVYLSDSTQFVPAVDGWTHRPRLGERSNAFADATGDGRADAIVIDDFEVWVYPSTGTDFEPPRRWAAASLWGYH